MSRNASEYPVASVRVPAQDVRTVITTFGSIEIYSRDPGSIVALSGRYFLQLSRAQAGMIIVSQTSRALADLAARHEKFGWVTIIEPQAELSMAADVKNGFNQLVKRYSSRITGAAIVFERTGFHATAVRSLVTAINFASRATHPNHVFGNVREGVSWVSKLTPGEPSAAGLAHIIQQLRALPA